MNATIYIKTNLAIKLILIISGLFTNGKALRTLLPSIYLKNVHTTRFLFLRLHLLISDILVLVIYCLSPYFEDHLPESLTINVVRQSLLVPFPFTFSVSSCLSRGTNLNQTLSLVEKC